MIKLFEEYNQYYTEISQEEYSKLTLYHPINDEDEDVDLLYKRDLEFIQNNWIDFTQSEISTLHNLIPKSTYKINPYTDGVYSGIPKASIEYECKHNAIFIIKMSDEWYYVHHTHMFRDMNNNQDLLIKTYKCDQFDGLLKCIKDIL